MTSTTAMTSITKGLCNIGNTCYLNSALQCLFHTKGFRDYFMSDEWKTHRHPAKKGHELVEETSALLHAVEAAPGGGRIVPVKFVRAFVGFAHEINEDIRFGAQADAAEAVQILLDGLHTQQAREVCMNIRGKSGSPETQEYIAGLESWATFFRKEYSQLIPTFYGQTQSKVVCMRCDNVSIRYDPWCVLKVPIPGAEKAGAPAPTLNECIRAAFATEKLDDYACDGCKSKGAAEIRHGLSRLPTNIVLSLKRFTNTGNKVRARIPYDEENIDFSEWLAWPGLQKLLKVKYRVYATIEHLGNSMSGHYIARASCSSSDKDRSWSVIDDANVFPSMIGGAAGPDTYMLFLEKV